MAARAHLIVFANEKGGSGKSTTAVHIAVALAAAGRKVAALDLDTRQRTMTRYLENRDSTMRRLETQLPQARYAVLEEGESLEAAIAAVSADADIVVIDTPGRDDPIRLPLRLLDEGEMTGVKRAHGRNQRDPVPAGAQGDERACELPNVTDCLHRGFASGKLA